MDEGDVARVIERLKDLLGTHSNLVRCFAPPPEVLSEFDLWLVTTERLRHEPRVRALVDFLAGYFANARYRAKPP